METCMNCFFCGVATTLVLGALISFLLLKTKKVKNIESDESQNLSGKNRSAVLEIAREISEKQGFRRFNVAPRPYQISGIDGNSGYVETYLVQFYK